MDFEGPAVRHPGNYVGIVTYLGPFQHGVQKLGEKRLAFPGVGVVVHDHGSFAVGYVINDED